MSSEKRRPLWLFGRYIKTSPLYLTLFLIFAPLSALIEIGLAAAMASAIDYAMAGRLSDMGKYVIAYAGYVLLSFIAGYGTKRFRTLLLGKAVPALKNDVYTHVMRMPYPDFKAQNSAGYHAQLTSNIEIIRDSYFTALLRLYPELLQFVVATVLMVVLSPWLGGYVLLLAVLQLAVPAVFSKRIAEKGKRYAELNESYMVTAKEDLLSYETSTLYQILGFLDRRHRWKSWETENARSASKLENSLSYEVSFAIGNVMYLGIYVIGAVLVLTGHLTVAAIVAAAQLMVYIANPLTTISGDIAELKSALGLASDYARLVTGPVEPEGGSASGVVAGDLELREISFSYGERKLRGGVSYTFQKGKKYIIHGESGCGKSTLLKIIERLLPLESGGVTLNGTDIGSIDRKAYARMLCCIPQEPFLFDDTILENVRLYRDYTEADVLEALGKAGLTACVKRLPDGIHTRIGENASFLSGGEKQRLAIARALLSSPEILLVDEGTSHLDPDTAREIESLIFSMPDMTVIAVSHILHDSTVRMAGRLLRMEGGKLREG